MDDLDLRRLRYFVTLAEELNFSRAAERLHMTQQSLSSAIARLERELGVSLFDRTTRRVALAEAGIALLGPARDALAAGSDAVAAAQRAAATAGTVSLGISAGVRYGLTGLLNTLELAHPEITLEVQHDSARPLLDRVAKGLVDMAAIFAEPVVGLEHLQILDDPLVVAITPGHELAAREHLSITELREHTIALDDPIDNAAYNEIILAACADAGFTPRTLISRGQHDAWEDAVHRQGCVGLTVANALQASHRDLRLLPLVEEIRVPTHLVWRKDSGRRRPIQAVVRTASQLEPELRPGIRSGSRLSDAATSPTPSAAEMVCPPREMGAT